MTHTELKHSLEDSIAKAAQGLVGHSFYAPVKRRNYKALVESYKSLFKDSFSVRGESELKHSLEDSIAKAAQGLVEYPYEESENYKNYDALVESYKILFTEKEDYS